MSSKYTRLSDSEAGEQAEPLLNTQTEGAGDVVNANPENGRTSTETAPPVYALPNPNLEGRPNVEYLYDPVYPRTGGKQYILSVLGRSKQETIVIVQRAIVCLAEFDPARISFRIRSGEGSEAHWTDITDEAWPRLESDPPNRLAIVVSDLPGEADERVKLHIFTTIVLLSTAILLFLLVFGISKFFS